MLAKLEDTKMLSPQEVAAEVERHTTIWVTVDQAYTPKFGGRWVQISKSNMRAFILGWVGDNTPRFTIESKHGRLYVLAHQID